MDLAQKALAKRSARVRPTLRLALREDIPAPKLHRSPAAAVADDQARRLEARSWLRKSAARHRAELFTPLLTAWTMPTERDGSVALTTLAQIANNSPVAPFKAEQQRR